MSDISRNQGHQPDGADSWIRAAVFFGWRPPTRRLQGSPLPALYFRRCGSRLSKRETKRLKLEPETHGWKRRKNVTRDTRRNDVVVVEKLRHLLLLLLLLPLWKKRSLTSLLLRYGQPDPLSSQ